MQDRERISILEELMSENLIRLDRLEVGQNHLKNGQDVIQQGMIDLIKVVRKNSTDIEVLKDDVIVLKDDVAILKDDVAILKDDVAILKDDVYYLKENMATKQMFASLLEAMVHGFDRIEGKMDGMRQDINILKAR